MSLEVPVRKKLPHAVPQWVPEGSWFFITINCLPRGINHICNPETGPKVLSAMAHNHEKLVWHCRLCLLMPDHLHAIMAFPREPGFEQSIHFWKKFVAGHYGVKWQRDFVDHRLRSDQELTEKTSYILNNPVRKGLCQLPEEWRWIYRPADHLPPRLGFS